VRICTFIATVQYRILYRATVTTVPYCTVYLTESFNERMKFWGDDISSQSTGLLRELYKFYTNEFVNFVINPVTYSEWMCNSVFSYRSYPEWIGNGYISYRSYHVVIYIIMYITVRLRQLTINLSQSDSSFGLLRDRFAEIRFLKQIRTYKGEDWPASHSGTPRSVYSPNRVILSHFIIKIFDFS
jgi:hypothetical protein